MGKTLSGWLYAAFLRFCEWYTPPFPLATGFRAEGAATVKCEWSTEELAAQWTLLPSEREVLGNKSGATRLGFSLLLKFFQVEGHFPR